MDAEIFKILGNLPNILYAGIFDVKVDWNAVDIEEIFNERTYIVFSDFILYFGLEDFADGTIFDAFSRLIFLWHREGDIIEF